MKTITTIIKSIILFLLAAVLLLTAIGCAPKEEVLPITKTPKETATATEASGETASAAVSGIVFPDQKITLQVGQSLPYTATVLPENAGNKDVRYTVGDDTVFTYEYGVVTARATGAAVLLATTAEGGFTARVYVNVVENGSDTTTPVTPTIPDDTTTPATPTVPDDTTTPVTPTIPDDTTTPVTPTIPDDTTTPATPTIPDDTTTPATPTIPDDTTTPVTPTIPGKKQLVSSFSMLTAGDNLYHGSLLRDARTRRREGTDEDFYFDSIYAAVADQIRAADYAVINQEAIILPKRIWRMLGKTTVEEMYYRTDGSFVVPDEVYDTLTRIGFDAIDMANNHVLDMGAGGLQWSLDYLNSREGLLHFGAYYDEADRANIRTAEINGITVAFLAYTYGTNVTTEVAAQETGFRFLVPYIDDEKMIEELRKANEIADFTVVFMHWGEEYSFEPTAEQRHAAKLLAENGAGIIIGHHTHTVQPIEYLDDGKGGTVLCAYSLGNLVSNMDVDRNMLGGFFTFTVSLYDDGSVAVTDPLFTPTAYYYSLNYTDNTLMYLCDLTPELAATHGIGNYSSHGQKNTMTVERMYEYLHNSIADEFLPDEYKKK